MNGMCVPEVPENPPAVLSVDDLRRLVAICRGTTFEDRRDAAILRELIDSGARLAELTGLAVAAPVPRPASSASRVAPLTTPVRQVASVKSQGDGCVRVRLCQVRRRGSREVQNLWFLLEGLGPLE